MKNEGKTGLRGEQGGDEERCEHACKCDAYGMQSLVSEIALLFLISILELIIKNSGFTNAFFMLESN